MTESEMILVCGEALFDVFLAGENPGGRLSLDAAPGGSPFNVAIGLSRLGRRAGFFGGLSRDLFGERLAAILVREGVDLAHAPRSDAPTTLAFVEIGPDRAARYSFRGEGAADRMVAADHLPRLGDDVKALTFGSYSTIVQPTGDVLLALAQREKSRRAIIYDPNVRPTIEPDMNRWGARFQEFAATAAIVKASEEDVALLMPGASADIFARAARAYGASLVVVTRGADGVAAIGPFGKIEHKARGDTIIDTVGAGDTVTAALIAWLDERDLLSRDAIAGLDAAQVSAMLDFAMRAAAITCSRRGADLPRRKEVDNADE